jgi:NAD-dependent dihydropyrimidine dehydrogenase PreA subunit
VVRENEAGAARRGDHERPCYLLARPDAEQRLPTPNAGVRFQESNPLRSQGRGCTVVEEGVTRMPYVICEPCVGVKDKACVEICPVDCIYDGTKEGFPDQLFIHPDECIDCGVCQPECPVSAIYPEDDVPEEWNNYIQVNRDFFA